MFNKLMTDASNTPTSIPPATVGELPDFVSIPDEVIQKWISLSDNADLNIPIKKEVIDSLFFSISKLVSSQMRMHACITEYSHRNFGNADLALTESRRFAIESSNHLAQFMSLIMDRAREV